MAGFLMVPRAGLRVCKDGGDLRALIWLIEEGESWGWGVAFPTPTSDLCEQSDKGRGWAARFLARLEGVGVLKVVDSGDRNRARTVSVHTPNPKKAEQHREQHREQHSEHDDHGATDDIEADDTVNGTARDTGSMQFDLLEETKRPREKREGAPRKPSKAKQLEADTQAAWDAYRAHHSRSGAKPPKTIRSKLNTLLEDYGLDNVVRGIDNQHAPGSWWVEHGELSASVTFKLEGFDRKIELSDKPAKQSRGEYQPDPDDPHRRTEEQKDADWAAGVPEGAPF